MPINPESVHRSPWDGQLDEVAAFKRDLIRVSGAMDIYVATSHTFDAIREEDLRFWYKKLRPRNFTDPRTIHYTARQIYSALEAMDGLAYLYDAPISAPSQDRLRRLPQMFLGNIGDPHSVYHVLRQATTGNLLLDDATRVDVYRDLIRGWISQIHHESETRWIGSPSDFLLGVLFSTPRDILIEKMRTVKRHKGIPRTLNHVAVVTLLDDLVHRLMHAWKTQADPLHEEALVLFETVNDAHQQATRSHIGFLEVIAVDFFEWKGRENYVGWMDFGRAVKEAWHSSGTPIYQKLYEAWRKSLDFQDCRFVCETAEINTIWNTPDRTDMANGAPHILRARQLEHSEYTAHGRWLYMKNEYIRPMREALGIPLVEFHLRNKGGIYEIYVETEDPQQKEKKLITLFQVDINSDIPIITTTIEGYRASYETEEKVMQLLVRAFEIIEKEHQKTPEPQSKPHIPPASEPPIVIGGVSRRRNSKFQPRGEHKRPRKAKNHRPKEVDIPSDSLAKKEFYPRPMVIVDNENVRDKIRNLPRNVRRAVGKAIQANNDFTRNFTWGKELVAPAAEGPSGGKVWQIRVGKYRILCEMDEDGQAHMYDIALRGDKDRFKKD